MPLVICFNYIEGSKIEYWSINLELMFGVQFLIPKAVTCYFHAP